MSKTVIIDRAFDTDRRAGGAAASLGAAHWLGFAATPSFALMALLTAAHDGGRADILCSAAHHASLLSGMAPMYGLMSAFHSAPWAKLMSRQRWQ